MSPDPGSAPELQQALQRLSVVVVTFNSAHCLPQLAQQLRDCPHVFVVDNGSDDGSASAARQLLPQATILDLSSNVGFGAANNRALHQVQTEFALLLNPDCEIDSATLVQLLACADTYPDAAMVAPQLTDARGRKEVNYRWPHLYWNSSGPAAEAVTCVGFVCGAAMLLRMSHFGAADFFDERFFLYYEDDDLCLRLFQQGKPMLLDPSCRAVHRSRGSVRGQRPWRNEYLRGYHHAQSKLTFTAIHVNHQTACKKRKRLILTSILALVLRLLLPSPRLLARSYGRLLGVVRWRLGTQTAKAKHAHANQ